VARVEQCPFTAPGGVTQHVWPYAPQLPPQYPQCGSAFSFSQLPLQQSSSGAQALPQSPQLKRSLVRFLQPLPLHSLQPDGHSQRQVFGF
jgi:hypothetical protein